MELLNMKSMSENLTQLLKNPTKYIDYIAIKCGVMR